MGLYLAACGAEIKPVQCAAPMALGPADRSSRLDALVSTDHHMLVVGGGITGAGVARDAAMRGFKVACVEQVDFGYGTSSRSSKLIHGGLRYLEQMNLRLVFEGTHERATVRAIAPHLVQPIPFLVPVFEESKHSVRKLGVGLWMYDALAGKRRHGKHTRHDAETLMGLEPTLRKNGLRGGAIYFDCMTDDARLVLENVLSAHAQGATMLNQVSFVRPIRDDAGHITGAVLRDHPTGRTLEARCRVLIQCAGPWTDDVLKRCAKDMPSMIRTTKGVHVVFPHAKLPVRHAVVMSAVRDHRVIFAIPRGRVTLVGTTDTDYGGDPDDVHATRDDVEYLVETVARYFPEHAPPASAIVATYAGLRPLVRDDASSPYDVSREHTVVARADGTVTIGGGKLTTYRRMASDVVVAAMKVMGLTRKHRPKCPTRTASLPGADGFDVEADAPKAIDALVQRGVAKDVATHLVSVYGIRHTGLDGDVETRLVPGLPFVLGEVDHAVTHEGALTPEDVLVRRLPVFYEAPDQGLECLEAVCDRMAGLLGWSPEARLDHVVSYRATVERSRRWRA